jgi:hypothetical protein
VSLARIVRALGGDLYDGGARASVPGPGHSRDDRSVSLLLVEGRVVVHCFAGDDWRAVMADLQARGLVDARGRIAGAAVDGPSRPLLSERLACARALWDEAGPIGGTLSERHCRRRGIIRALPAALRHHPSVPSVVYRGQGFERPALLAAIRDGDGGLCGLEVTYLAPDGGRARLRTPRKTVGSAPRGSAVRLDPPAPRMLVAEGVFSALSASERFGLPAWALLSAGNLRAWSPPSEVREVVVAADRGEEGERSALRLAEALRRLGREAWVRWPPAPFADWNDVAAAEPPRGA